MSDNQLRQVDDSLLLWLVVHSPLVGYLVHIDKLNHITQM